MLITVINHIFWNLCQVGGHNGVVDDVCCQPSLKYSFKAWLTVNGEIIDQRW